MRHFLFEEKEYRINPRFKRKRNEQDSAQALARLIKRLTPRHKAGFGGGGGAGKVDFRQRCVVKAQYSKSIEAHRVQLEEYLSREGSGLDGGHAKIYGADIDEYRKDMVEKNYRIFLSPESGEINLTELAGSFIKKLELQLGCKLKWVGANHYNTAHPHAHILINGVDKDGKEVNLPRDVVKTFMRETAMGLCTSQIGQRSREDIAIEREKALTANRFTKLDNAIKGLCADPSPPGVFRVNLNWAGKDRSRILTRLEHLRKLNLCSYVNGGYHLADGWDEKLQANGRYNCFLEARSALKYTNPASLQVYYGSSGPVMGKATKVFRTDDDASDNHAVILETLDGRAFFVPLFKKPELRDQGKNAKLSEGDLITLQAYKSQKGRLTPFMYKAEEKDILREIQKKGHAGNLAKSLMGAAGKSISI